MAMDVGNLNFNSAKIQENPPLIIPKDVPVVLRPNETGMTSPITGTLYLSGKGYVYSKPSKPVVWFKFLALAVYLPLQAIVSKCVEIAKRLFGCTLPEKGYHDMGHMMQLAGIAWKGVVNWGNQPLLERMEEFALTEVQYNAQNSDMTHEMSRPRSDRFSQGFYIAKCMQPLFDKAQYRPSKSLNEQIQTLTKEEPVLTKRLAELDRNIGIYENVLRMRNQSWYEWGKTIANNPSLGVVSLLPNQQINLELNNARIDRIEIQQRLNTVQTTLPNLRQMLGTSYQCEKYIRMAVWNQQCCPDQQEAARQAAAGVAGAAQDAANVVGNALYSQREVKCLGTTCYREQKICCLFNVIDCCDTRCYAIDCICCACCIWPEGDVCLYEAC